MKLLIYVPVQSGSTRGNRITADRWAKIITGLGHNVTIVDEFDLDPATANSFDVLVALHARKSAAVICEFKRLTSSKPVVVALTGTDLHGDYLGRSPDADTVLKVMEMSDRIVMIEPESVKYLPQRLQARTRVIIQSAVPLERSEPVDETCFEVSLLGHLRDVKDPFLAPKAANLLPADSKIKIVHVGQALTPEMKSLAEEETRSNSRYEWIGPVSHLAAQRILVRSRLTLLTSKMEGGPSVVSEAVVNGVPILMTRIPAAIGMLGKDYPGLFEIGDELELSQMMSFAETNDRFYRSLISAVQSRIGLFLPETETKNWASLLAGLYP